MDVSVSLALLVGGPGEAVAAAGRLVAADTLAAVAASFGAAAAAVACSPEVAGATIVSYLSYSTRSKSSNPTAPRRLRAHRYT